MVSIRRTIMIRVLPLTPKARNLRIYNQISFVKTIKIINLLMILMQRKQDLALMQTGQFKLDMLR
jgi:hypothetical protein